MSELGPRGPQAKAGRPAGPRPRIVGIGKLGQRLVLAFIGVVLAALFLDILVTVAGTDADIGRFVRTQEGTVAGAVAVTAGTEFHGGRWGRDDLRAVIRAAAVAGAGAQLIDSAGRVVGQSPSYARLPSATQVDRPVVAGGARVGEVRMRFGPGGLRAAVGRLNSQRWHARFLAFALAFALALAVSVLVARRITAPLERLLATVRARGAGDRQTRITDVRAAGELGELLEAFNAAADALDERDQAQRALVDNTAHELRTPVAILQAGTEAMLDGITQPSQENLASLHDEIMRLGQRLDDLQALARASSATLGLELAVHDLQVIARDAAARLADVYDTGGVGLELHLEPAAVSCDYGRMAEIVTNLMTNALKYTPRGGMVTIQTRQSADGRGLLRVSDTGIGIPGDELPRVTERFFRGASSPSVAAGSGIGLAIVAELARAQRGKFDIESRPDSGTEATITFPLAAARRPRRQAR